MSSPQFTQAVASFVVLLISYAIYSSVVAPMIEGAPPGKPRTDSAVELANENYERPTARFQGLIDPLFPEGSWERQDAKILKTDRLLLLLKDYRALEDHRLHLSPCTIVLLPGDRQSTQERTWVIQAIEGAIIEFDQGMDIRRGQLGRIVAAYVPGSVKIRGSALEGGEPIELSSRNLQFDASRVWTPHEVDFRIGKSFGSGRDLTILLNQFGGLMDTNGPDTRLPGTVVSQVRSVELVQLDRLHVDPSDAWGQALDEQARGVPVDVSCGGSLFVDVISGIARLTKDVRIVRRQSDQVFDQLDCEQLDASFSLDQASGNQRSGQELGVTRLSAQGNPARFASRQRTGDNLHRIESPEFAYDFAAAAFTAAGIGRYMAVDDAARPDTDAKIAVQWRKRLRWNATSEGGRLELEGGASCQLDPLGRIEANTLGVQLTRANQAKLWTREGRPTSSLGLVARRVWGHGNVVIDSERLQASTRDLQVTIVDAVSPGTASVSLIALEASKGPNLQPAQQQQSFGGIGSAMRRAGPDGSKFQISGGSMQLEVAVTQDAMQLNRMAMKDGVRCVEVRGEGQTETVGVELSGNTLQLEGFGPNEGTAVIQGSPALIRVRQVDVAGPAIHFDRAANRIWVEGAGTATLPLPQTIAQRAPNQTPTAYLGWQDRMAFDGQTITCGQDVRLQGPTQRIRCNQLTAVLNQPIDLSAKTPQEVAVDRVKASGKVTLESRTLGANGLESIDSAEVEELTIWQETGRFTGLGPGWLETVRFGSGALSVPSLAGSRDSSGARPAEDTTSLVYLRVAFERALEGNIHKRQVDFIDRVQATYGSVKDWNERIVIDDPRTLPKGGLIMRCDRLSVFQIVHRYHAGLPVELVALGNVTIEGSEFAAQAHRMSYDQAKDQIVLVGDGRSDARLWRHGGQGNRAATHANKIEFWPGANRVKVDGFKGMVWGEQE